MTNYCLPDSNQDLQNAKETAQQYLYNGFWDPTVDPTEAKRGTLFLRTGTLGGALYQKQDDDCTANWIKIATLGDVHGLTFKAPTRLRTQADIGLTGLANIDGVTPVAGDRILVANQAAGDENGIYIAAAGAWTRSEDFDEDAEVLAGCIIPVTEGVTDADTLWMLTTDDPITVGVTALVFAAYGAGGGAGALFPRAVFASSYAAAGGDGSMDAPFNVLQDAVDYLAAESNVLREKYRGVILISPDSRFDEDILIPAGRHMQLVGMGPWTLGDGAGSNFSSTTPRNIVLVCDQNEEIANARPVLVVAGPRRDEAGSTHVDYANGVGISGSIILRGGVTPATTVELHVYNAQVEDGIINDVGSPHTGNLNTYLYSCYIKGTGLVHTTMFLQRVVGTRVNAPIVVNRYSLIERCELSGPITFTANGTDVPPLGILNTVFGANLISTPAAGLRVDGYSLNSILTGGATLSAPNIIDYQGGYVVANAANWVAPVPTNLQTALQRLEAQVQVLTGGAIP